MVVGRWSLVRRLDHELRCAAAVMMHVMMMPEHGNGRVAHRKRLCQRGARRRRHAERRYAGSGFPFVSSPNGSSNNPIANAIDVNATGVPIVW